MKSQVEKKSKTERKNNMNEIQIFKNSEFGEIRTLMIEDEPYFVGKDVATVLGYADTFGAIKKHVDDEDKQNCQNDSFESPRGLIIINESGLYSLILSSKLPTAKKFKRWVTSEVLPTIRKHGAYMTDDTLERALTSPDFLIQLATNLKEEQTKRKALETTVAVQEQQIIEMKPKASYYDVVLNCPDLISISIIAKDYGKSAKWLNDYLHKKGIQYKQGSVWLLYAKYAEQGYTSTKTHSLNGKDGIQHSKVHTYWTQKGRLFIYDLLKSDGIYPAIEEAV